LILLCVFLDEGLYSFYRKTRGHVQHYLSRKHCQIEVSVKSLLSRRGSFFFRRHEGGAWSVGRKAEADEDKGKRVPVVFVYLFPYISVLRIFGAKVTKILGTIGSYVVGLSSFPRWLTLVTTALKNERKGDFKELVNRLVILQPFRRHFAVWRQK